ncbi:hypothetical protein [Streptomyces sp. NPDC054794]
MPRHVSNDLKSRAHALAARENLPYSTALARLRTPAHGRTHQPAADADTFEYLYVFLPLPELHGARPCDICLGTGRESETPGHENALYFMKSDGDRPPIGVEAACSICLGCGRAEHNQDDGCGYPHTDEWLDADHDDEDEDEREQEPPCPSCHGRQFNYMPGFPDDGGQAHGVVIHLRVPCSCTADEMTLIREVTV